MYDQRERGKFSPIRGGVAKIPRSDTLFKESMPKSVVKSDNVLPKRAGHTSEGDRRVALFYFFNKCLPKHAFKRSFKRAVQSSHFRPFIRAIF